MKAEVVLLTNQEYTALSKVIESGQDTLYFQSRATEELICIENYKNDTDNQDESKNVVIAWMDKLMSLATDGFNRSEDKDKNRYLSNIYSYCEAIRTCVSGK